MKAIMAGLTALASALALAQDWTHEVTEDAFSDEKIWVASVHHQAEERPFALFVNCQADGSVNVGLTGTYLNPVGGEWANSRKYHGIPVRFDDDEPFEEHFVEQDDVMFLAMSPLIRKLLPEEVEPIQKRILHIFVKNLADGNRLRMKFPQHQGSVVLDFPLAGSKDALLATVQGCGVTAAEGTKAFRDAHGEPYATLADMLMDETWRSRQ